MIDMEIAQVSHTFRLDDGSFREIGIIAFNNEIVIEFWNKAKDKECPINSISVDMNGKVETLYPNETL